ncbi:MAG: 2-succinyl-5-enolpyruvyl-6-hydroxy-3-cyclohexene-1-carboxylic-acid synthase, partial [Patulibacter sp.]|nr:2-succinyl-5-enolpyruvyl-6-hydroxy-3-cyclohexene-1-carboxylic-acid synthase [Patulibacter sp.]
MEATSPAPRDGHGSQVLIAALLDELARGGATDVVTSPGSRNTPVLRAVTEHPGLRAHSVIDERVAGFVALGLAKSSGRPVVLCCTSGSAAAHYLPAVIEAHHARIPLVALTADRPAELRDVGAGQTIQQVGLFGDAVRWSHELAVDTADAAGVRYARSLAGRSLLHASGAAGRGPGPVHLNLPLREPLVPTGEPPAAAVAGRPGGAAWVRRSGRLGAPDREAVRRLGELLLAHPDAVVVAGRRDEDPELGPALAALCELLQLPLFADPLSGARRGTAAIARYDGLLSASSRRLPVPSLVLRVGDLPTSKPLRQWLAALPSTVPQVHVTADGAWQDPDGVLSELVVADPRLLLEDVAPRIAHAPRDPAWLDRWRTLDERAADAHAVVLDEDTETPTEPWLARELVALLPPAATLLVAASMPIRDVEAFMAPRDAVRVLANRGANGIDGTIATAWGLALDAGGRSGAVHVLLGDVALQHDVGALIAAGRAGVDLTVVLVDNDGGGIFHFLPVAEDRSPAIEQHVMTPTGLDVPAIAAAANAERRWTACRSA